MQPKVQQGNAILFSIIFYCGHVFDNKISYIGQKLEMELVLHQLSVLIKEAQLVEIVHLGKKLQYFVLQLISHE